MRPGWRDALLWTCLAPAVIAADETERAQALEAGKAAGRAGAAAVEEAASRAPDADQVPGYRGDELPERDYYDLDAGIEDKAREKLPESEAGMHLRDTAARRPRFTFDARTDPVLTRGRALLDNPEEIAGTMVGVYGDCTVTTQEYAPVRYAERSCTAWGAAGRICERELQPLCLVRGACQEDSGAIELSPVSDGDVVWEYRYPLVTAGNVNDDSWSGPSGCSHRNDGPRSYVRSFRFGVPYLARIETFRLLRVSHEDYARIRLNGVTVFGLSSFSYGSRQTCHLVSHPGLIPCGSGTAVGTVCRDRTTGGPCRPFSACDCYTQCCQTVWNVNGSLPCERGSRNAMPDLDLKPHLVEGENVLELTVWVAGRGDGWLQIRATQNCCRQWEDRWTDNCAYREDATCRFEEARCLEPAATRTVEGESVHRVCWREMLDYTCVSDVSVMEEDYCRELREEGCEQIGSECADTNEAGNCIEYEQAYRCPQGPATARQVMNCGERSYCLDGNCFDTGYEPSADFGRAASALAMVEEAVKDFDTDTLAIFTGTGRRCKKAFLGFSNCCRHSGWGLDLGLHQCSANERTLAEQRRAGLCHYVGSYKTGNLFSKRRYRSFCCFNSRLGRIVHEQGREQLGIGWGRARGPRCRGLTPQELTAIDFERVDFGEVHAELLERAEGSLPADASALSRIVEERLSRYLEQGDTEEGSALRVLSSEPGL